MSLLKKAIAECIGTFVLTLVGCGTAQLICGVDAGGYAGTALAFGLAIVAMAYSIGNISGCHINPAVSLAMLIAGKMSVKDFLVYVAAQLVGGILAGALLLAFFHGDGLGLGTNAIQPILYVDGQLAASSYILALLAEIVLTAIFVGVILGVTSKKENNAVTGLVIGGGLTFVHLLGIGLTGTSVNPARSIGPALFALANGIKEPIQQIWIFIIGPLVGAAIAALIFKLFEGKNTKEAPAEEAK